MRRFIIYLLTLTTLNACSQNSRQERMSNSVFIVKDSLGRVVEKWGNESTWDNDVNFRYFYSYDIKGLLKSEKQYHFDDSNVECEILDSLDFILVEYVYDDNDIPILKKKFFPEYGKSGNVLEHKLGYVYYYKTGIEEVIK